MVMMSKTLTKMNPEVKQKWIDALRSGKYEQGENKLRSVTGYCCLGVLCDLYAQEHDNDWELRGYEEINQPGDYWYFEDQSEFTPDSVRDWAGLPHGNPTLRVDVNNPDEEEWFYHEQIADLNDSGYTFEELSKLIEQQL